MSYIVIVRAPGTSSPLQSVIVVAAFQLLLALLCALLYVLQTSTLATKPARSSSKTTLARGVMGARQFVETRNATSGGELDLGAWHGNQEVVLKRPLRGPTAQISFDFEVAPYSYLYFLFNKTADGFAGVRLSAHPDFPSMQFVADRQGRFLQKTPVALGAPVSASQRHRVAVSLDEAASSLRLDGGPAVVISSTLQPEARIGFRGSFGHVVIDDVAVRDGEGPAFHEAFVDLGRVAGVALAAFLLLTLASLAARLVIRRVRSGRAVPRPWQLAVLTAHLVAVACAGAVLLYVVFFAGRTYPLAVELADQERAWTLGNAEEVDRYLSAHYAKTSAPATYRILFLGTSQTWGAGAERLEDVIANQVERRLGARLASRGQRVECINAGLAGANSNLIRRLYLQRWVELAPDLVVVNLSHNDNKLTDAFPENLDAIVQANRDRGIETLFVAEPVSVETNWAWFRINHERMRAVAERRGIAWLDMQSLIARDYDAGLFWWDRVHLTSFGQSYFAEQLSEEIWRRFLSEGALARRPD